MEEEECIVCYTKIQNDIKAKMSSCVHILCFDCYQEIDMSENRTCPGCRAPFVNTFVVEKLKRRMEELGVYFVSFESSNEDNTFSGVLTVTNIEKGHEIGTNVKNYMDRNGFGFKFLKTSFSDDFTRVKFNGALSVSNKT